MTGSILQISLSPGGVPKRPVGEALLSPLGFEGDGSDSPIISVPFKTLAPYKVKQYTEEAVRTVSKPVHSGLFIDPLDAAAFTKTIEMALAGGAAGVSIFDAGAMNAERWALFAKAVAR